MKCNKATLADIMGWGLHTVESRLREGMPYLRKPGEDGSKEWLFDTVAVIEFDKGRIEAASATDIAKDAKNRTLVADAGLKEIELADKLGLIFYPEDVLPLLDEMLGVSKSRYLAVAGRCAPLVAVESDPAECLRILTREVNATLEGMQFDDLFERARAARRK